MMQSAVASLQAFGMLQAVPVSGAPSRQRRAPEIPRIPKGNENINLGFRNPVSYLLVAA